MKLVSARCSLLVLLVVGLAAATTTVSGFEGRWKLADDGSCYWDSTDSGADQCEGPGPTRGRWKLAPDGNCVWDANDSGPHQCSPSEEATEPEPASPPLDDGGGSLPSSAVVASPPDLSVEILASPAPNPTPRH